MAEAPKNPRWHRYMDKAGEWRWVFYAKNGEPLAVSSEGYKELRDCDHAIDLIKSQGPAAPKT